MSLPQTDIPVIDWHLYVVRCRDGSLYTGITTDVARRFVHHQGKGDSGAKYLRGRGPITLVFQKKIGGKGLALSLESRVKKLSKAKKEEMITNGAFIDEMIKKAGPG